MLTLTFLTGILKGHLFLVAVPESLTVLAFGIGLFSATAGLRWVLKRRDEKFEDKR